MIHYRLPQHCVSVATLSTTRAIPLSFDQIIDQRSNQVTRVFATVSSAINTKCPGPLSNLVASLQLEMIHDDNLPLANHADARQENIFADQLETIAIEQQDELVDGEEDEDEEARAVNEAQLVNDMLQDQPDDLPIGQQEGFVDDGAIRVVDDEPLIENMTQDHQEGDAKNKSS